MPEDRDADRTAIRANSRARSSARGLGRPSDREGHAGQERDQGETPAAATTGTAAAPLPEAARRTTTTTDERRRATDRTARRPAEDAGDPGAERHGFLDRLVVPRSAHRVARRSTVSTRSRHRARPPRNEPPSRGQPAAPSETAGARGSHGESAGEPRPRPVADHAPPELPGVVERALSAYPGANSSPPITRPRAEKIHPIGFSARREAINAPADGRRRRRQEAVDQHVESASPPVGPIRRRRSRRPRGGPRSAAPTAAPATSFGSRAHRPLRDSHTETWAGCMVSATTPRSSRPSASRSTSSRSRAPKPRACARVVAAAVEAPVDQALDPGARGRNSAATASVEAATARSEPPSTDENDRCRRARARGRRRRASRQRAVDERLGSRRRCRRGGSGGSRRPRPGGTAAEAETEHEPTSLHVEPRGERRPKHHGEPMTARPGPAT